VPGRPDIIRRHNLAAGGVNDGSQGSCETIGQFWIRVARRFHAQSRGTCLERITAVILADPEGRCDDPLRFWPVCLLFSVAARRHWVDPDRERLEDGSV
jgi:hypothetical protein